MHKVVVWGSGEGTTLEYLWDQIECGQLKEYRIVGVVASDPWSRFYGIALARSIPTLTTERRTWQEVVELVRAWSPDLAILAGYMQIVPPKVLLLCPTTNIHPSYLPEFPGKDPQKRALDAKAKHTGVTMHHVTPEVDAGPIIAQYRVPILELDTLDSLEWRLKLASYRLLSKVLEENLWKEKQ